MPEKIRSIARPQGFARIAFRIPIWLYRAHLGWLLGTRFVLLTHTGRKSGLPRQAVLEVVRYVSASSACIVASGWDERSDWFHNVTANPKIFLQIGNKRTSAVAVRLSPGTGGQELVDYAHRHPLAFRELVRFMGYRLDGTEEDIRTLGQRIPMFIFKPVSEEESTTTR